MARGIPSDQAFLRRDIILPMQKLQKISFILSLLSCIGVYLILLNQMGVFTPAFRECTLTDIRHEDGFAYVGKADDPMVSRGQGLIRFFEDELSFTRDPAITTEEVRNTGNGLFAIWNDGLICFSTSDHSDPLTNGRVYSISYPVILGSIITRYCYTSALGFFILFLLLTTLTHWEAVKPFGKKIWRNRLRLLPAVVFTIPTLYCLFRFMLNQPFWSDETHSLLHYCFNAMPFFPATIYDLPNNHIFLDLIISAYAKLVHVHSFCDAVLSPWKIRILFLLFSFGSIGFCAAAAAKINRNAFYPAVIIVTTTIPFYLWTTQVRGYSLLFLLFSALIYVLLCIREKITLTRLTWVMILTALSIYTLPFAAVFIGGMMVWFGFSFLADLWQLKKARTDRAFKLHDVLRDGNFQIILAFIAGLLMAAALYYPVLDQVIANFKPGGFVGPTENGSVLTHFWEHIVKPFFMTTLDGIISKRWLLISLILVGAGFSFSAVRDHHRERRFAGFFLTVLIVPFLLCGIAKYTPFTRHFSTIIPAAVIAEAAFLSVLLNYLPTEKARILANIGLFLYCSVVFCANVIPAHLSMPESIPESLESLYSPYYMAEKADSGGLLSDVKEKNIENLPVVVSWPADFYLYDFCSCYDLSCSADYVGAYTQNLIRSGDPYYLIQTLDQIRGAETLPEVYQDACQPVPIDSDLSYRLYRCDPDTR